MQLDTKIASVYAEAVASLAGKQLDAIGEELEAVLVALTADDNVWRYFRSPVVDSEAKIALLSKTIKADASELVFNLLGTLARKRRFDHLPGIVEAYIEIADRELGRQHVGIESASALSAEQKEALKKAIGSRLQKDIVLKEKVRADLIGGVVVRSGDLLFDSSISNRLKRIRQAILERKIVGKAYYEN
ncbi:MAG: ATP synthase F1 subunit delta [Spirochaetales bacterium]|nr:ATP synthase F1 subunit delta [Leptospiraceae bacterium]MCP5481044.1 ATP synthase F1 subunit delta [Spirochaetales bacterium]MCP5485424.1 ATP synthase F1 subunit delta [Spirochaetales bacterium]